MGDSKLLLMQGDISDVGVWSPRIHFAAICFVTYFICMRPVSISGTWHVLWSSCRLQFAERIYFFIKL